MGATQSGALLSTGNVTPYIGAACLLCLQALGITVSTVRQGLVCLHSSSVLPSCFHPVSILLPSCLSSSPVVFGAIQVCSHWWVAPACALERYLDINSSQCVALLQSVLQWSVESWKDRLVWDKRDLKGHPAPALYHRQGHLPLYKENRRAWLDAGQISFAVPGCRAASSEQKLCGCYKKQPECVREFVW